MSRTALKFLFIFILTLLSTACSKSMFFAANLPSYFSKQKIIKDVDFSSDHGSKLNIYIPDDNKEKHAVIMFFYGGKWQDGNKDDYRFVADALTEKGFIVVIADYVKYPKVKFPEWQKDAAKATVWVHNNIAGYSGDNSNLFLAGHSSGAHIAAILATDRKYIEAAGGKQSWIKAVAGIAGPYHFIPEEADLKDIFGPPENYKYMHVDNYIDGNQPPILLQWGKKDKVVGQENIEQLESKLKSTNSVYDIRYYDGLDHVSVISSFTGYKRKDSKVLADMVEFFNKQISNNKR